MLKHLAFEVRQRGDRPEISGIDPAFTYVVVFQQLRNPVISSESGLRSLSECPVLVTVPSIVTQKNQGAARRRFLTNLAFSVASSVVLAISVVFLG